MAVASPRGWRAPDDQESGDGISASSPRLWLRPIVAAVSLAVVLAQAAPVLADTVSNNLDATVDATAETMSLTAGDANGVTQLSVNPTSDDGKQGCNLTAQSTLVVAVSSSNTGVATVRPELGHVHFVRGHAEPNRDARRGWLIERVALSSHSNSTGGSVRSRPCARSR